MSYVYPSSSMRKIGQITRKNVRLTLRRVSGGNRIFIIEVLYHKTDIYNTDFLKIYFNDFDNILLQSTPLRINQLQFTFKLKVENDIKTVNEKNIADSSEQVE